ncbi:hypothetical protein XENOCAPTIV_016028, partial [Xenoophorus captivus]
PLPIDAANETYMLQRPSSLFWFHSIKSLSCLEISSVTLTPMSSPDSNMSTGLLTPPPAKPTVPPPKATEGFSIPRPRVNTLCFLLLCCFWFSCFFILPLRRDSCEVLVSAQMGCLTVCVFVQAGSVSMKPQSTDIFDMVPFSPVTPLVPTKASNGCPPPPPTTLPPDISEFIFSC